MQLCSTHVVVVQVEEYCIRGKTLRQTLQAGSAADHVHLVPDVLHVKVDGFFSDLAVTVLGTSADCFLRKKCSLMKVVVLVLGQVYLSKF